MLLIENLNQVTKSLLFCQYLADLYRQDILVGWLYWGFNATLTAKVISWRSVTHVFPGFLTPVLTQLFFPKPPTTFLTCFCRGERRKYTGKKSRLNRGSNLQPPGHKSDTPLSHPGGAQDLLDPTLLTRKQVI